MWDPKVLAVEGMPLRFVNKRKHCSIVYKLCRFDEIEVPHAEPVSGSKSGGYGAAAESTDRPAYYEKPVVVHIRPGETAWVRVKPGVYHLRLSEGRKWFGPELMFGPSVVSWGGKEGALAANKASESPFRKQCTE